MVEVARGINAIHACLLPDILETACTCSEASKCTGDVWCVDERGGDDDMHAIKSGPIKTIRTNIHAEAN